MSALIEHQLAPTGSKAELMRTSIASLQLIRELDVDVLAPSAAIRGQPFYELTSQAHTARRIDAIVERLRAGRDH